MAPTERGTSPDKTPMSQIKTLAGGKVDAGGGKQTAPSIPKK
jgi:hypothetical protein